MDTVAGWYADPEDPSQERYWDGTQWAADRRPAGSASVPPAAAPAPYYPPQQQIPGAEKKLPAGILGILLGGLGIHRFYLGDVLGGFLRILITVVTCGIGSIIGLVEGIIYLTKSDQEFVEEYLVQGKQWF